MRIKFPFDPPAPAPDKTPQRVPGKSGDWVPKSGTYNAVDIQAQASVFVPDQYSSWSDLKTNIERWLFGDQDWLKVTSELKWLYRAEVNTAPQFVSVSPRRINATITFHVQPYKYEVDRIRWQNLPYGSVIYKFDGNTPEEDANGNPKNTAFFYNDGDDVAIPDWHIRGKGNFMLYVNGLPYEFDNIDGDVYVPGWQRGNAYTYDIENPEKFTNLDLLNENIRFANNTTPQLLCSGTGKNSISLNPMDSDSVLELAEFKPKIRGFV